MDKRNVLNGIIWKTVQCISAERKLSTSAWPSVLGEALHCIRSLISTATGSTPHDRFLGFERLFRPQPAPASIQSGNYAWLRRQVCSKNDSTGDLVKVVTSYPGCAIVSRDGVNTDTVNWRHLAPHPRLITATSTCFTTAFPQPISNSEAEDQPEISPTFSPAAATSIPNQSPNSPATTTFYQTRSDRFSKPPSRFGNGENVINVTNR